MSHTFDPDVFRLIPIDVDNFKVVIDIIKTMIFSSMTFPCV